MLILPTILFIVIIGAGSALAAWVERPGHVEREPDLLGRSSSSAVIALVILVVVPFVRWRTEHFVITNHHVFFRTGLLSRREHQIPLGQIANMETEVTFWGRLMGYGSLIVESSADQPLKFRNVASLSKVQATLNQLIRDERERTHRRGNCSTTTRRPGPQAPPQQYAAPATSAPNPTQQYPSSRSGQYPPRVSTRSRASTRRRVRPAGQYPPQQGYPTQQGYPPGSAYLPAGLAAAGTADQAYKWARTAAGVASTQRADPPQDEGRPAQQS